jgi:threonine/homoserine/homoserine lactone efflux protein
MSIAKLLMVSEKIILGITLAAPIGPVSIEMIKRGLGHGFWAAFSIRLGGAVGNTLCLIVTYLGLSQIMGRPVVMNTLGLLGAVLLLYMGISTLRTNTIGIDFSAQKGTKRNGLLWGFYLSIISPVALVFWPGIFAASMSAQDTVDFAGFLLNLFVIVGVLIWGVSLSLMLAFGNRFFNKTFITVVTKGAALFMIFYGLKYAYSVYLRI